MTVQYNCVIIFNYDSYCNVTVAVVVIMVVKVIVVVTVILVIASCLVFVLLDGTVQ